MNNQQITYLTELKSYLCTLCSKIDEAIDRDHVEYIIRLIDYLLLGHIPFDDTTLDTLKDEIYMADLFGNSEIFGKMYLIVDELKENYGS